MRKALVFATLLSLICTSASLAGIPDPSRSGIGLSTPSSPCQYKFRSDGGLDRLTVKVTLRDAFDSPVSGCNVNVTLIQGAALAFKVCTPCNPAAAVTAGNGVANVVFRKIGGRGTASATVTATCTGNIGIGTRPFTFSSPDLNGSGDNCPTISANVVDLGIWAAGLPPAYNQASDYDCSGSPVNVVDLGVFAGGLSVCCNGACP
jgi:hypothetical protein